MADLTPLLQAAADELAVLGWTVIPPARTMDAGTPVRVVGQPFYYRQGGRIPVDIARRASGRTVSEPDKDGDVVVLMERTGAHVTLNIDCLEEMEMS